MSVLTGPTTPPVSGRPASALVVFLHGYGADGNDLIGLSQVFSQVLPYAAFASPHAPQAMGMGGRAWFPLTMRDPSEYERGVAAAAPSLDTYLDAELARHGLAEDRLALVGFSQGTMMALHVGYRRPAALACVVGYSGLCATVEGGPLRPAPTLLIHGTADEVVPPQMTMIAAQMLSGAGIPVEFHMVSGLGHGIEESGLRMAADQLRRSLPPR